MPLCLDFYDNYFHIVIFRNINYIVNALTQNIKMLQIDLGIILGLVECLSVHFTLLPDNHNKLHLILHSSNANKNH